MNYGLIDINQAFDIAHNVAAAFAPAWGATPGALMLMETAAAETGLGTIRDPQGAFALVGVGLCQFDQIGFDDVLKHLRPHHRALVLERYGVDLETVQLRDLAMSPLLSFIFCRLKYARIPAPIPDTLQGRAQYWKDHYNSHHENAAGTPKDYIEKARFYVPKVWDYWENVAKCS